jgi:hypothetical protein
VLVSFAGHGRSKSQSFPRKACPELAEGRESTPPTFGNGRWTDWIPAFAGMTGVSKGIPSQMTTTPTFGSRSTDIRSPAGIADFRLPIDGGDLMTLRVGTAHENAPRNSPPWPRRGPGGGWPAGLILCPPPPNRDFAPRRGKGGVKTPPFQSPGSKRRTVVRNPR